MALKIPESWNDCGMDWGNIDPLNPYYYLAIVEACVERFIVHGSSQLSSTKLYRQDNCRALLYDDRIIPYNIIDIAPILETLSSMVSDCITAYIDPDAFFEAGAMNPLAELPYRFGRTEALQPSSGSFLSNPCIQQFLRMCYDCLNKATLYRGATYWFVPGTVTAKGEYGTTDADTPYNTLKAEAEAKYNEKLQESFGRVQKSFTNDDSWFETMHFKTCMNASGEKMIRRENNWPYIHCHYEIMEEYPAFYVKSGFPYNAKIHAISYVEDFSEESTNEYGITSISENAATGWGGIGKNILLDFIPSVTAGESYWLTDTQQRPINYPNKDVTVPPCNTEGWAVHTQKMASEIYFCLDLNCEGGFNFRPDDTKLKGIKQR